MRSPHRPALIAPLVCVLFALATGAAAEIYKWTDSDGHVHFTQDLGQVPAQHRPEARLSAHRVRRRIQTFESQTGSAPAQRSRSQRSRVATSGRRFQIPFEKRGNTMFVYVELNDRVTIPFIVDTGASDVSIPALAAKQAGIVIGPDTPRATYQTANGAVSKPIVIVDSVSVGGLRVEGVRGSVSTSMNVGLLGGAFFNNFTFQIDPAAQLITLEKNDAMRAGRSEKQWRAAFRALHSLLRAQERYLRDNQLTDLGRVRRLAEKRDTLEQALAQLEAEADRAGVPQSWRLD